MRHDRIHDNAEIERQADTECWALASNFLTELIGAPPVTLRWDSNHHLKGHVSVCGCELVVVAPRDTAHRPVVLTALDWDEIHTAPAEERAALLGRYAIADHDRLVAVLARNDLVPTAA